MHGPAQYEADGRLVEVVTGASTAPGVVFTCEHAGNDVPEPIQVEPEERRWLSTHWGHDIGAGALTRALAARSGGAAVLARFSRLFCDTNREWGEPTCIRREVEGHTLRFNRALGPRELAWRKRALHDHYHEVADRLVGACRRRADELVVVAIHSFTARYNGEVRSIEAGVLFDEVYPGLARRLAAALNDTGLDTALNEPYSGLEHMIYSAARHGRSHAIRYLEIEVRNDLIADAAGVARIAPLLLRALQSVGIGAR